MKLYMRSDDEGSSWYLSFDKSLADACRSAKNSEITIDSLSELMDQEAENANFHAFVGSHAWLGKLIKKHAGREVALKILVAIAEHGGLHEGVRE